jgi:hypothetical protein
LTRLDQRVTMMQTVAYPRDGHLFKWDFATHRCVALGKAD